MVLLGLNITRVTGELLRAYRRFLLVDGKSKVIVRVFIAITVLSFNSFFVSLI